MKKFLMMLAVTAGLMAGGDIAPVSEPVQVVVEDNSSYYVGVGYSVANIDSDYFDDIGDNFTDMGATTLQAGYNFNDYVAVEGRYTGDFSSDYSAFVFGKLSYANVSDFTPYILLGAGTSNFDNYQAAGGVGVEYSFYDNFDVYADYIARGYTESDINADITTVGIKYTF